MNNQNFPPVNGNISRATKRKRINPWGPETYTELITAAIESSMTKCLVLQDIYNYMCAHKRYFNERRDEPAAKGWHNQVRHTLSTSNKFTRIAPPSRGMSSLWKINPSYQDRRFKRSRLNVATITSGTMDNAYRMLLGVAHNPVAAPIQNWNGMHQFRTENLYSPQALGNAGSGLNVTSYPFTHYIQGGFNPEQIQFEDQNRTIRQNIEQNDPRLEHPAIAEFSAVGQYGNQSNRYRGGEHNAQPGNAIGINANPAQQQSTNEIPQTLWNAGSGFNVTNYRLNHSIQGGFNPEPIQSEDENRTIRQNIEQNGPRLELPAIAEFSAVGQYGNQSNRYRGGEHNAQPGNAIGINASPAQQQSTNENHKHLRTPARGLIAVGQYGNQSNRYRGGEHNAQPGNAIDINASPAQQQSTNENLQTLTNAGSGFNVTNFPHNHSIQGGFNPEPIQSEDHNRIIGQDIEQNGTRLELPPRYRGGEPNAQPGNAIDINASPAQQQSTNENLQTLTNASSGFNVTNCPHNHSIQGGFNPEPIQSEDHNRIIGQDIEQNGTRLELPPVAEFSAVGEYGNQSKRYRGGEPNAQPGNAIDINASPAQQQSTNENLQTLTNASSGFNVTHCPHNHSIQGGFNPEPIQSEDHNRIIGQDIEQNGTRLELPPVAEFSAVALSRWGAQRSTGNAIDINASPAQQQSTNENLQTLTNASSGFNVTHCPHNHSIQGGFNPEPIQSEDHNRIIGQDIEQNGTRLELPPVAEFSAVGEYGNQSNRYRGGEPNAQPGNAIDINASPAQQQSTNENLQTLTNASSGFNVTHCPHNHSIQGGFNPEPIQSEDHNRIIGQDIEQNGTRLEIPPVAEFSAVGEYGNQSKRYRGGEPNAQPGNAIDINASPAQQQSTNENLKTLTNASSGFNVTHCPHNHSIQGGFNPEPIQSEDHNRIIGQDIEQNGTRLELPPVAEFSAVGEYGNQSKRYRGGEPNAQPGNAIDINASPAQQQSTNENLKTLTNASSGFNVTHCPHNHSIQGGFNPEPIQSEDHNRIIGQDIEQNGTQLELPPVAEFSAVGEYGNQSKRYRGGEPNAQPSNAIDINASPAQQQSTNENLQTLTNASSGFNVTNCPHNHSIQGGFNPEPIQSEDHNRIIGQDIEQNGTRLELPPVAEFSAVGQYANQSNRYRGGEHNAQPGNAIGINASPAQQQSTNENPQTLTNASSGFNVTNFPHNHSIQGGFNPEPIQSEGRKRIIRQNIEQNGPRLEMPAIAEFSAGGEYGNQSKRYRGGEPNAQPGNAIDINASPAQQQSTNENLQTLANAGSGFNVTNFPHNHTIQGGFNPEPIQSEDHNRIIGQDIEQNGTRLELPPVSEFSAVGEYGNQSKRYRGGEPNAQPGNAIDINGSPTQQQSRNEIPQTLWNAGTGFNVTNYRLYHSIQGGFIPEPIQSNYHNRIIGQNIEQNGTRLEFPAISEFSAVGQYANQSNRYRGGEHNAQPGNAIGIDASPAQQQSTNENPQTLTNASSGFNVTNFPHNHSIQGGFNPEPIQSEGRKRIIRQNIEQNGPRLEMPAIAEFSAGGEYGNQSKRYRGGEPNAQPGNAIDIIASPTQQQSTNEIQQTLWNASSGFNVTHCPHNHSIQAGFNPEPIKSEDKNRTIRQNIEQNGTRLELPPVAEFSAVGEYGNQSNRYRGGEHNAQPGNAIGINASPAQQQSTNENVELYNLEQCQR
ncbi:hypothetical protein ACOME3_002339 [Neoechinorhynchus agilis]